MDAIEAGVRIALHTAGCRDVDVAVKVGAASGVKLTDAGDVDPASVAAAVGAFRAAKPYLFGAASTSADPGAPRPHITVVPDRRRGGRAGAIVDADKSALDMSPEEYKATKSKLVSDWVWRRWRPAVDFGSKNALETSPEEYAALRRRARLGSPLLSGRTLGKKPSQQRPAKPSYAARFFANREVARY